MSLYRQQLPFDSSINFITDAGLETELVFKKNYELPEFASFPLLEDNQGRKDLEEYYKHYFDIARQYDTGVILEAPTWRANSDWAKKLHVDNQKLVEMNIKAIEFLSKLRTKMNLKQPCLISGCIGPRYDAYEPEHMMSVDEAKHYHSEQIKTFYQSEADLVCALTINNINEAYGITLASKQLNMPVVISFTTETDGLLPSGESLQEAIEYIDEQSDNYPIYYMINCAHPTHFESQLKTEQKWIKRIHGVRANASCKSHAELDESTELDEGDPKELGLHYRQLQNRLSNLKVFGGCCGTNHQHVSQIAQACLS